MSTQTNLGWCFMRKLWHDSFRSVTFRYSVECISFLRITYLSEHFLFKNDPFDGIYDASWDEVNKVEVLSLSKRFAKGWVIKIKRL